MAAFVNSIGSLALGPFLPLVAVELGENVALVGQVTALTVLLAGLLGLVAGPLADRFGYGATLIVGLLAVALSGIGTGLATGFAPLLAAALVGAIGRAVVVPTGQAVAATYFTSEAEQRRAISWIGTGTNCAPLLGVPLLTAVAGLADWRAAFFLVGALALATVPLLRQVPIAATVRSASSPRLATILTAYAPLVRHRPTLALVGQVFLGSVGTWATFTYLGAYLAQQHGFGAREVGVGYLVVGVGTVLGAKSVGTRLGSRPRLLLLASRVAGSALLGAALILPLPALAAVALLALGALVHTANSVAAGSLLAGESPTGRATTLTFNNAAMSLGVAAGGAIGGAALAVGGYRAVGFVSLAWLLAATCLIWWADSRASLPMPPPAAAAQ